MLTETAKKALKKQSYRVVGTHSAVKTCGWTKKMVKGEGGCYKLKFYGIMSHQCLQMTTSISCANRCTFCWRGYKAPVSKTWEWDVDDPKIILNKSLEKHYDLLVGYKGNSKTNQQLFQQSKTVKHVALSLTGEPIIYPRINDLLRLFNERGISTFMVTNAQYPDQIRDLNSVTQLYCSVDAPNKQLLKEIDLPLFSDHWERMIQSLKYLAQKKERTCIRLTVINGINDVEPENYAELIKMGDPDFVEVKGYMFVGESRQRLNKNNMPWHEEVVAFSKNILKFLNEYELISEHIPSRVVLLAKKKFFINGEWKTWIDFTKWEKLVNVKNAEYGTQSADDYAQSFSSLDYVVKTPSVGISGRKIKEEVEKKKGIYVNEETEEVDFWNENKDESSKNSNCNDC